MYVLAERDDLDLAATWIPADANEALGVEATEPFDPIYMKALLDYAYQRTIDGQAWFGAPHISGTAERFGLGEAKNQRVFWLHAYCL